MSLVIINLPMPSCHCSLNNIKSPVLGIKTGKKWRLFEMMLLDTYAHRQQHTCDDIVVNS